ncbi:COG complex component [Thelephora ganbajun]|uniref:COG complex component n=1 Tax=Thelephora ganbajun TaxID=370292 RepID=A0ACB6ZM09_THEGA|nr:COG complex component [Thelephora ganbajun]
MQSPTDLDTRDPFQLQRLADELPDDDDDRLLESQHALPSYKPLSHNDPYLSAETFDVELFLQSRSYTSLPDLRTELRDYLATLKEELVQLINDDYEAFISLSTDLRGEGMRLERLKWPLADLKSQTLVSKQELEQLRADTQDKLKKRAALRDEKAFLHLLLKISESVSRLESLLLIESTDSTAVSGDLLDVAVTGTTPDEDQQDERVRGNRAKHLSRVASEYTQLLYHVSKTNPGKCAFVTEVQWRVDRIKSTLFSDLDKVFAIALASDTDKTKFMIDVFECLRTYDVLGLWREAEEIIRRNVVDSFVKKNIFPAALNVPHSPLIPQTPISMGPRSPVPPCTASFLPRTPYTPFTAFASKQDPFALKMLQVQLLDESLGPLALLYNQIIKFVERDLKKLAESAEAICIKSGSRKSGIPPLHGPSNTQKQEPRKGFDIMANAVWAEIGQAIMDELGSAVFAAGKTDEFRKNHETTEAFIRALECLAPSVQSIESMRAHPVYTAFQKRWQIHTYFQLRWKEIVVKCEEALVSTKLDIIKDNAPFTTNQAIVVWNAISACWSNGVYMPVLSYRFWKLTLQLIGRYKMWLEASLPPFEPPPKVAAAVAAEKPTTPQGLSRSSTPGPQAEAASAESIEADNQLLKQFSAVIIDIATLETQVLTLWNEELCMMLPESAEGTEGSGVPANAEVALRHALASLTMMIAPIAGQIVTILCRRASDALLPVRSIPSQFRAMQNKKMPTERSYFVPLIMRPVSSYFGIKTADGGMGTSLKDTYMKQFASEVFRVASQRYLNYLLVMKKTEESLRRLKKGKKSGFSLFGSGSTPVDDGKDEERIRHQMALDVEAFRKDAIALGVDIEECQAFVQLEESVRAAWIEEPQS